jgi:hypothetical protein
MEHTLVYRFWEAGSGARGWRGEGTYTPYPSPPHLLHEGQTTVLTDTKMEPTPLRYGVLREGCLADAGTSPKFVCYNKP